MTQDEKYITRCLELAKKGLGSTAPNPMVGAVAVHNDKIIGEGYHRKYGGPHAEVHAINSVRDKSLLKYSTLYVSLEPCSHLGKTPPCTDLIIKSGIPKVVIGTIDPNSLVKGKGIEKLRSSGIEVKKNILIKECIELNKRFFTFYSLKRPYIILKWAQTSDGFIDIVREPGSPVQPNWISNEFSRILVHKWRSEEQAIMVGTNTVRMDNPTLNTREWEGKNPLRIFLDRKLSLSHGLNLYNGEIPTIIINEIKNDKQGELEYVKFLFDNNLLNSILYFLYTREIQSIIIEGGKILLESFIEKGLWDEARVFTGDKKFRKGIKAPVIDSNVKTISAIENDRLLFFKNPDIFPVSVILPR